MEPTRVCSAGCPGRCCTHARCLPSGVLQLQPPPQCPGLLGAWHHPPQKGTFMGTPSFGLEGWGGCGGSPGDPDEPRARPQFEAHPSARPTQCAAAEERGPLPSPGCPSLGIKWL